MSKENDKVVGFHDASVTSKKKLTGKRKLIDEADEINEESSYKTPGKDGENSGGSSLNYVASLSSNASSPYASSQSNPKRVQVEFLTSLETNGIVGGVDEDTEDENDEN